MLALVKTVVVVNVIAAVPALAVTVVQVGAMKVTALLTSVVDPARSAVLVVVVVLVAIVVVVVIVMLVVLVAIAVVEVIVMLVVMVAVEAAVVAAVPKTGRGDMFKPVFEPSASKHGHQSSY